ncbi:hypothetical protein KQX54_014528 [Cotesia glomerata]|uniref:Uncharacterized protein n=1 Tax=Cotesia glomerata TaxID=32391 RepID=A0AAV7J534_COTGL|nr:hypothetical protein KQX54_014528 [Cotesia glomerata]
METPSPGRGKLNPKVVISPPVANLSDAKFEDLENPEHRNQNQIIPNVFNPKQQEIISVRNEVKTEQTIKNDPANPLIPPVPPNPDNENDRVVNLRTKSPTWRRPYAVPVSIKYAIEVVPILTNFNQPRFQQNNNYNRPNFQNPNYRNFQPPENYNRAKFQNSNYRNFQPPNNYNRNNFSRESSQPHSNNSNNRNNPSNFSNPNNFNDRNKGPVRFADDQQVPNIDQSPRNTYQGNFPPLPRAGVSREAQTERPILHIQNADTESETIEESETLGELFQSPLSN